jgi:integrase/recombinase XerC
VTVLRGVPSLAETIPADKRTAECRVCGVPSWRPCPLLTRHLDWMRMKGMSESTVQCRRYAIERMGRLMPVPVIEAGKDHLMAWRGSLAVGDGSAASYICHARELYKWLIAEGYREDNPAMTLPVPKVGRRLPRPISESDLMTALDTAPARIRIWLVLAAWCGLRAKEIALIRRESIMETARPPVLLVTARATKGRHERIIPLSSWVTGELARADLPGGGYAFRRHDGLKGPNNPWLISQLANRHLHACGSASTLHTLRHRFGTATYAAGHDLRVTQELLGHVSPVTTSGYTAFSNVDAAAAVEALAVPRLRIVKGEAR